MTQREDVIAEPGRVGVMRLNPQIGFVMQQAIENVRRIAHGGVDDPRTISRRPISSDFGLFGVGNSTRLLAEIAS
jgi:hypothetical protein